jgi:hypothetical protein
MNNALLADMGDSQEESRPLRSGDGDAAERSVRAARQRAIFRNFMVLSSAFSLNHAVVVTALSLASAELGDRLGSYGSGVLYVCYCSAALFLSSGVVAAWGAKRAMVVSLSLYSLYVSSYLGGFELMSSGRSDWAWVTVVSGSVVGGLGAGWMWTAQGAYFTGAARAYATGGGGGGAEVAPGDTPPAQAPTVTVATGRGDLEGAGGSGGGGGVVAERGGRDAAEVATGRFAGAFGFVYLALEVLIKVTVSAVMSAAAASSSSSSSSKQQQQQQPASGADEAPDAAAPNSEGVRVAFSVALALAAGSAVALQALVWDDPADYRRGSRCGSSVPGGSSSSSSSSSSSWRVQLSRRKLMLAIELLRRPDRKMLLLAPFQVAFGAMASLLNFYVNGTVTRVALGSQNIGYLTAVMASTAALLSPLFSALVERRYASKAMLVGAGLAAMLLEAVVLRTVPTATLQRLGWAALAPLYALHGVGRAVFETTNKAIIADYFGHGSGSDTEAAFANVIVWSGGASAIGFFVFPSLAPNAMAVTCIVVIVIAMACFFESNRRHKRERGTTDALLRAA